MSIGFLKSYRANSLLVLALSGALLGTTGCPTTTGTSTNDSGPVYDDAPTEPAAIVMPPQRTIVAEGFGDLQYSPPQDGAVYAFDLDSGETLARAAVRGGDRVVLHPSWQQLEISGSQIPLPALYASHTYQLVYADAWSEQRFDSDLQNRQSTMSAWQAHDDLNSLAEQQADDQRHQSRISGAWTYNNYDPQRWHQSHPQWHNDRDPSRRNDRPRDDRPTRNDPPRNDPPRHDNNPPRNDPPRHDNPPPVVGPVAPANSGAGVPKSAEIVANFERGGDFTVPKSGTLMIWDRNSQTVVCTVVARRGQRCHVAGGKVSLDGVDQEVSFNGSSLRVYVVPKT